MRSAIAGLRMRCECSAACSTAPTAMCRAGSPSIARHLRQLAVAQHVSEQGGGPKDIARELGLRSEFVARKLSRQSARWSPEQLSAAIVRIAAVERETRGEGVLRDRFALERALTEAVGPAATR